MSTRKLTTRPTIADVAAKAGVSTVTVSRVLNGANNVSEPTREKVTAAMDTLGYYGNAAATQLVSGKTQTIGVLTSTISAYGYATLIEGVECRARERGYSVLITVMEVGTELSPRDMIAHLASQTLAGIIVLDLDQNAAPTVNALPGYLPVVAASKPIRDVAKRVPVVFLDDASAGREAADLLLDLGHSSIFVLGAPASSPDDTRASGVFDALADAHLPMFPVIPCADWSPESGYNAMKDMLDRFDGMVTAVFCANDEIALGAISAISESGLRVPEDISVVGFDDNPLASYSLPPLTTVRQDFHWLGAEAFDLLENAITGEPGPTEVGRKPDLIVRGSTAPRNPDRGVQLPS